MEWRHTHAHTRREARLGDASHHFFFCFRCVSFLLFLLLLLLLLLLGFLLLPQAGHQLVREECWNRQRECGEVSTSCVRRTLKYAGQHTLHVKNAETGRISGKHILWVKNEEC